MNDIHLSIPLSPGDYLLEPALPRSLHLRQLLLHLHLPLLPQPVQARLYPNQLQLDPRLPAALGRFLLLRALPAHHREHLILQLPHPLHYLILLPLLVSPLGLLCALGSGVVGLAGHVAAVVGAQRYFEFASFWLRLFGLFFELVLVIVLAPRRVASVLLELGNVANLFVRLLLLGLSSGVEAQVVLRLTVHRLNIIINQLSLPTPASVDR
jgi:hypothetical protein